MSRITVTVCAWITLTTAQICYRLPSDEKPMAYRWWQDGVLISVSNGSVRIVLEDEKYVVRSMDIIEREVVVVEKQFAKIPSLESLSLEGNLIRVIEDDVFRGLPNLLSLNLARNLISTLYRNTFAGLTKLNSLNLNHNSLIEVAFLFNVETLPKLTHLYLQNNGIKSFNNFPWIGVESTINVSHLYLSNNRISHFAPHSMVFRNLSHLYLEYNFIRWYTFSTPFLLSLSLDGNRLTYIPKIESNIIFLSAPKNCLEYVDSTEWKNKNISHLMLSRNEDLRSVCSDYGPKIDSLRYLAVDYTSIRNDIDGNGFACFPFLTHLDISGNQLTSINSKIFWQVPYLQELVIADNRLTSFIDINILSRTKINYLDVSYNQIRSISNLHLNASLELKYLKIEGNPLTYID